MKTLTDFRNFGRLHETRFKEPGISLYLWNQDSLWRIVADEGDSAAFTGPACKTKDEMFAVLPQVAANWHNAWAIVPCCQKFDACDKPCTPRGKHIGAREEREHCAIVAESFDVCDPKYIAQAIRARETI